MLSQKSKTAIIVQLSSNIKRIVSFFSFLFCSFLCNAADCYLNVWQKSGVVISFLLEDHPTTYSYGSNILISTPSKDIQIPMEDIVKIDFSESSVTSIADTKKSIKSLVYDINGRFIKGAGGEDMKGSKVQEFKCCKVAC